MDEKNNQYQYQSGLGSLFATHARTMTVEYVYHRDHQNDRWNAFKKTAHGEEYVTYFLALSEAKGFCNSMNGQEGE